jgi:hypothetical protein
MDLKPKEYDLHFRIVPEAVEKPKDPAVNNLQIKDNAKEQTRCHQR